MNFSDQLSSIHQQADEALKSALNFLNVSDKKLADAMEYSLFNGGKRVRPLLVRGAAEALGYKGDVSVAMAAVEMIHSYSLVHDDLPAMDDDDLRRGKPTCHIAFDEATAILAGDALLTGAFEVLAEQSADLNAQQRLAMINELSKGAGASGMVAGQAIDLAAVGKQVDLGYLENMHVHKTGALIRSSVLLGAYFAQAEQQQLAALKAYSHAVGLAFQVQDDILDIEGDTAVLGKQQGADIALNKPTYPALLGLDGAKQKMHELHQLAVQQLEQLSGDTGLLKNLADYIVARDH